MVRHGPPWVIFWGWLGKPYVARVPGQLPAIKRPYDGIPVANLAPRGIHQIGTPLHLADQRVIEQMLCLRVQGGIDRDYITNTHQRLGAWMEGRIQFLLHTIR